MAVKIRLRRMGTNKKPFYRIVVADERSPSKGRFLETVGWYDPKVRGANHKLDMERIEHWTAQGAQVSDTVRSLMKQVRTGRIPKGKPVVAAPPPPKVEAVEAPPAEEAAAEPAPAEAAAVEQAPAEAKPVEEPVAEAESPAAAPVKQPAAEAVPAEEPAPKAEAAETPATEDKSAAADA